MPIQSDEKIFVEGPLTWSNIVESRTYQNSIAEKACLRNTLVVLPTALGKTIISALVAHNFLLNYRRLRVLVMAPTRPLVQQHKDRFMNVLKLREKDVILLTGRTPNVYRKRFWEGGARIIFATPQVVENDLKSGLFSLKDFSLLIFDECHRARKDYAYTYVAKKYVEQSPWPIILGLTASPGADKKRIEETCNALYIEQVEYRSEEDDDVAPYVNPIKLEWTHVKLPNEYNAISKFIRSMLDDKLNRLNQMGVFRKKIKYVNRRDLLEVGEELRSRLKKTIDKEKGPIYSAIIAQSAALTLFHALELLETQGIWTLRAFLDRVEKEGDEKKSYRTIVTDPNYVEVKRLLDKNIDLDHPKIMLLKNIVEKEVQDHSKSRILVFTQYRDTASHLVDQLKTNGISVERFVGQASKAGDPGLTQEEQASIINKFSEGETEILVATCIAEEGLDIPSVNLVVFYEPIPSEIRYIQRRGRTGRKAAGKVVILAAYDTYDMAYLYASKSRVERMKKVMGNLNERLQPLMRLGPIPEPDPIPNEELEEIEKEASTFKTEPELAKSEEDKIKELRRTTEKSSRLIYERILRAGEDGVTIDKLADDMGLEDGLNPAITRTAIEKLRSEGLIRKPANDRVYASSIRNLGEDIFQRKDVYDVLVEKVYPGVAVVWINQKWRARVTPQDFEGPINLIKKDTRFKAKGTLYHEGGKLCFRVREVVQLI